MDTNIVVSALLFGGAAEKVHRLWRSGGILPLVSADMVREYARVLSYPKFHLSEEEVSCLLNEEILPFIVPVTVFETPSVVKDDPSDDVFFACSGDRRVLALKTYNGIPVLSLNEFLSRH
ncbi:MAG: PIN domain-containing protein [Elusimicrobia bacterium]|nr:PIN domain-containing protein [Elusimicrobiota bacterium]